MEKEVTDEELIAHLSGKVNKGLEERILSDATLQKRLEEFEELILLMEDSTMAEVPEHIGEQFSQAIQEAQQHGSNSLNWWQIAAAVALIIVGFGMGRFTGQGSSINDSNELAILKDEIQSLKAVTMASALRQHSASERIMAVNQIEKSKTINPTLSVALINTFNADDSPNVRYEALQALKNYIDDQLIRSELVKSLETQTNPLIQISLINILVNAEEQSAITPLQEIIENEITSPEVKQQAEIALKVLI